MVTRRHVVYLEVGGEQGTGFLVAPDRLVTALHVIVELDDDHRVICDAAGQPKPLGSITCTYHSATRGHWAELIEFAPERDPFSISEDYVVLTVAAADGVHVWPCAEASEPLTGARCSTYGFPASHVAEGAPLQGSLTSVGDPHAVAWPDASPPTMIPIHRAWFQETAGPHGYAALGFSGAPLVVADRVVGLVRSFLPCAVDDAAGSDRALASTLYCTPITPVLIAAGIEPVDAFAPETVAAAIFEGPNQSPAQPLPFFCGRERELAELERLLCEDDGLVCIVAAGLGGAGKTYLAQQFVATRARERFSDGVAWIDGHQLDAELVRVSRRFGWRELRDPSSVEANTFLAKALQDRDVLLVIDDFDSAQSEAKHLPRPGMRCRTLVTSRVTSLDVDLDATRLDLGVWTQAACRDYLRERCDELEQVIDAELDELAEFVGRLPLGVRLLVSIVRRRKGTSPAEILAELRARPVAMLDGYRGSHRGVAATFSASYEALSKVAQRVLSVLAVCARQTRRDIVEAIVGEVGVGAVLDDLHDRGLAAHAVGAEAPWGMHDLVRLFVCEQPGHDEANRDHLRWVNELLDREWEPTQHVEFGGYVDELRHTFWRELSRDIDEAGGIYDVLGSYLTHVGRHRDAIALGEALLDRVPVGSDREEQTRQWLAVSYMSWGAPELTLEYEQRALERARSTGAVDRIPFIINNLGAAHMQLGQARQAEEHFVQAIELATEQGTDAAQASALGNLGHLYEQTGRPEDALSLHERCLALNQSLGRMRNCAIALGHLGDCQHHLGDFDMALRFYSNALAMYEKEGIVDGQAAVLDSIATCHQSMGQIDEAIAIHRRAIELARAFDNPQLEADRTGSLGVCLIQVGRLDEAREAFNAALAIDEKIGRTTSQAISLGNIGFCLQFQADFEGAIGHHRRAYEIDEQQGNYGGQLRHLQNIVTCYAELGRDEDVDTTLAEAHRLAEHAGDLDNQAGLLLSMALQAMNGDKSAALGHLERALALAVESSTRADATIARIREILAT